jgi:hypothetical protein
MLDFLLSSLKVWRPSRYRGIGIRGGLLLGIFWIPLATVASQVKWDPLALTFAAISSALVGYRLERISGAIAVVIFSLVVWAIVVYEGYEWYFAAGFGFVMGLGAGARTSE